MADSEILSNYSASRYYITLTFKGSIQVSTISTDDFTFETIEEPQEVPFKNINLEDDYNSIRKTLVLYFAELPPYSGDYNLTISGLRTAAGYDYPTETLKVPYNYDNKPHEEPEAPDNFVDIEDHSIREDVFTVVDGGGSSDSQFSPVSVDPETNGGLIAEDYGSGVITIRFSKRPNIGYVNDDYIKVQKKQIVNGYSRWENVDNAIFSLDGDFPTVYIYMPSDDATPVYGRQGREYFEQGYKYRVRFSSTFAANA